MVGGREQSGPGDLTAAIAARALLGKSKETSGGGCKLGLGQTKERIDRPPATRRSTALGNGGERKSTLFRAYPTGNKEWLRSRMHLDPIQYNDDEVALSN